MAAPVRYMQPATALCSYNENGAEARDLSFRRGDIIIVTEETNAVWWTGSHNGREGFFPSNCVEKISRPPPTGRAVSAPAAASKPSQNSGYASPGVNVQAVNVQAAPRQQQPSRGGGSSLGRLFMTGLVNAAAQSLIGAVVLDVQDDSN